MNIYIMAAISSGYIPIDIMIKNYQVKGIITLNERTGKNVNEYYNYKNYCLENKIAYISVESYSLKNEKDIKALSILDIDVLIVMAWQRLVPAWLIEQCNIGVIGAHGSPWGIEKGRGRSPQNWALILGEKNFQVSIFWITADADSGEVIDTKDFHYTEVDDINTSYIKVGLLVGRMIVDNLKNGKIQAKYGIKQSSDAEYLPKRVQEDGWIDWNRPGKEIYNFVRALTKPYPGAYTKYNDSVLYIWSAKYIDIDSELLQNTYIGELAYVLPESKLLIRCSDGYLYVDDYSLQGSDILIQGLVFETVDFKNQIKKIISRHTQQYDLPINRNIMEMVKND